ncbi:hypothetical protein Hdeb2414_s0003g00108881 [Helianthus debilis subsp. tardiflorus]
MYKSASGSRGTIFPFCMSFSLAFLLDFDYYSCPVAGLKPGKGARKVDVSNITPPTSPPSRTFDLSPPHSDSGEKRKEDDMKVEHFGEGGSAGAGAGDGRGGGERASHQKRESEYLQRIAKLQQLVTEKSAEVRASEIIAEEANANSKWLLARDVPLIADRIVTSEALTTYMYELGEVAYDNGRKDGYAKGRAAAEAKETMRHFDLYKSDCAARYAEKRQEYEFLEFAIVKVVGKLSWKPEGVELLRKALGDQDHGAGGAGPSHQD